ncbi:hypothetical protein [Kiloniella sp. b19]|uniref:hypothetical protein n=1 Tax=Kiloniella sp. GXU_MW_B19 TaxID=3141326 RepID=UPI0031D76EF3
MPDWESLLSGESSHFLVLTGSGLLGSLLLILFGVYLVRQLNSMSGKIRMDGADMEALDFIMSHFPPDVLRKWRKLQFVKVLSFQETELVERLKFFRENIDEEKFSATSRKFAPQVSRVRESAEELSRFLEESLSVYEKDVQRLIFRDEAEMASSGDEQGDETAPRQNALERAAVLKGEMVDSLDQLLDLARKSTGMHYSV